MREDWAECNLGDLLTIKNGFAFKARDYIEKGVSVFRIGDINDWVVSDSKAKRIKESIEYDDYIVKNGDILIAMSGATTGKFGVYKSDNKAYQNQRVGNLKPHSNKLINKKYIFNLLYFLKHQIEEDAYGGAQPNISSGKIHALNTVLAPLPIQRSIAAKIEELFSSLDSGISNLKIAQKQLKIYRQAVLKKAFDGELTKEWRNGRLNLSQLTVEFVNSIGNGIDITNANSFGWVECCFEDLLDYEQPTKYIVKSTKYSGDYDIPVLTAGKSFIKGYTNETDGIFDNLPTIIFDDFTTSSRFVDFKFKVKSSAMKILVPTSGLINMKFAFYCMQANSIRSDTHKRYWISVYAKKCIFIPSAQEQKQIVQEIESRLLVCDKVEQNILEGLEKAKALRQSILKKAFEGRLLSGLEIEQCKQEEDYEPASVLLKRIKAEKITKEKADKEVKTKRKK